MDMQYRPSHVTLAGTTLRPDASDMYRGSSDTASNLKSVGSQSYDAEWVSSPPRSAQSSTPKSLAGTSLRPATASGNVAPVIPEVPCHIRPLNTGHVSMLGTSLRPGALGEGEQLVRTPSYPYKHADHLQGSRCTVGPDEKKRQQMGPAALQQLEVLTVRDTDYAQPMVGQEELPDDYELEQHTQASEYAIGTKASRDFPVSLPPSPSCLHHFRQQLNASAVCRRAHCACTYNHCMMCCVINGSPVAAA
jgi:hypothetical protein